MGMGRPRGLHRRPGRTVLRLPAGVPTLYIIDDCAASKALTENKDILFALAFSGRHAEQSVWVLTQKYNAVLRTDPVDGSVPLQRQRLVRGRPPREQRDSVTE